MNNYCLNVSMGTIFMNTENSKTNEPHKSIFSLPQRLDSKSSICFSSKFTHSLHLKKYQTAIQKE